MPSKMFRIEYKLFVLALFCLEGIVYFEGQIWKDFILNIRDGLLHTKLADRLHHDEKRTRSLSNNH